MIQMNKSYLTRAQSRALSIDHPVGDPFGGAAYREMRDSKVIAMVGGAALMATGVGGALGMGLMASAGAITTGAAIAGGAMTLVGAATGNKTLSTIGSVVGLAGGIAGGIETLTAGSAAAAEGASAASYADALTAGASDTVATPYTYTASAADSISNPGSVTTDIVNPAESNLTGTWKPGGSGLTNPLSNMPGYSASGDIAYSGSTPYAGAASPNYAQPTDQSMFVSNGNGTGLRAPGGVNPLSAQPSEGVGVLGSVMDIIKKNPDLINIGAKTVGGIASVMDPKNQATVNYANSAADLNSAKADATKFALQQEIDRRARLNSGFLNVNQGLPQNLSANVLTPGSGLINGARVA